MNMNQPDDKSKMAFNSGNHKSGSMDTNNPQDNASKGGSPLISPRTSASSVLSQPGDKNKTIKR